MLKSAYGQSAIFLVVAAVALFASAGTPSVASFWLYLAILATVIVASLAVLPDDLIQERMRPGGKKPPLGLRLLGLMPLAAFIIAGLDRGRFHWSDSVPLWLQGVGLILIAAGCGLAFWAMTVNRFFSSIARIQEDRGQRVIDSGPYALVRHPGYSGAILLMLGTGIALGSWLVAALVIAVGMPLLLHRVITEERLLLAELAGYRDYAGRVRWRMLPGIW